MKFVSVQMLPSGRWRPQVWNARTNKWATASHVLGVPGTTYATRAEAEVARQLAITTLRSDPQYEIRSRQPSERWGIPAKRESTCRRCAQPARHLHHIVPKALAPEGVKDWRGNGLPLCDDCHMGWHNRAIDLPHEVFTDAEFLRVCELASCQWIDRHYAGAHPAEDRAERLRQSQAARTIRVF